MEQSLYISLFAIHQAHQNQGLGRETMDQVILWGDERGLEMTLFDHEPGLVRWVYYLFKELICSIEVYCIPCRTCGPQLSEWNLGGRAGGGGGGEGTKAFLHMG